MDEEASAKFVSSLTMYAQSLCHEHITFTGTLQLFGNLYICLDNGETIECAMYEKIYKTKTSMTEARPDKFLSSAEFVSSMTWYIHSLCNEYLTFRGKIHLLGSLYLCSDNGDTKEYNFNDIIFQPNKIDPSHNEEIHPSHDEEIDQSHDQEIDQLHDQDIDQLHDQEIDQLHDQEIDQSHDQEIDQSHDQEIDQTHDQKNQFYTAR